ncbi:hypothetical protein GCM10009750_32360 [Agromyces salentinus]|uniref:HNH nuclease domain-containing protein n=2 Tax=Agromyces salentinus TaxID=269421 RepID=A0ABP4Z6U7_9MICO
MSSSTRTHGATWRVDIAHGDAPGAATTPMLSDPLVVHATGEGYVLGASKARLSSSQRTAPAPEPGSESGSTDRAWQDEIRGASDYDVGMAVSRSRAAVYARRRKRRLAQNTHDLTDAQWQALMAEWGGCAYCTASDRQLQRDCVQPISRGGRYTLGNVVPACGACNASKSNDEVTSWLRRKNFDERMFLIRQHEIGRLLEERFAEPGLAEGQP